MKTIAANQQEQFQQTTSELSEITLESGARFDHALIGNCGTVTVHVKKDALYSPFLRSDESDQQEIHLQVNLLEPGAEVDLKGLLMAKNKQSITNTVTINHLATHTSSNQYLKTLAEDLSSIIADATIHIHKEAAHSSAHQLAKNLLLSSEAHIQTEPKLEIENDDVQASHGTSVGSLDQEALYYLQSRGIGDQEAREILTNAFIDEMLANYHYE